MAVAVVGVAIWLLVGILSRFDVTVNGEKVTVGGGSTIQTLLDKKVVNPTPGDLLDVEGSLLEEGKGEVCAATINGNQASTDTKLEANCVVEIGDGNDLTEDADVSEKPIEHKSNEGDRSFEAYWYGSIHLLSDGEDGVETVKTGKISGKSVSEVTKEPIDTGYRIYTAQPEDKVIALTFDDGPWPDTTNDILDVLEKYDAKATFFTIGDQIAANKDAVKRAHEMGCQICTHTWDHAAGSGGGTSLAKMSATEQVQEIKKGYQGIADVLGEEPKHVLRAPGGNFFGDVIKNVWDVVDAEIGWDVDTEDWRRPGTESILNMILSVKSGQVVLMHDGGGDRAQTVEALKQAMPTLVEKGFKFITIDELLAYGLPSSKSSIPSTTADSESSSSDSKATDSGSASSSSSESSSNASASSSSSSSANSSSASNSSNNASNSSSSASNSSNASTSSSSSAASNSSSSSAASSSSSSSKEAAKAA